MATSASPTNHLVGTAMTGTHPSSNSNRPPMRNKSSSQLSSNTAKSSGSVSSKAASAHGHHPKRNKSSTSLHSAHHAHHHAPGHHTVSFQHHGHSSHSGQRRNSHGAAGPATGSSARRTSSGSSGRRPAFGFGMTSMNSDDSVQTVKSGSSGADRDAAEGMTIPPIDGDDQSYDPNSHGQKDGEQQYHRPGFERSGTSERTLTGETRGRSKSRERDSRGRRSPSSSKYRRKSGGTDPHQASRSRSSRRDDSSPHRTSRHASISAPPPLEVNIEDVTPVPTPMATPPAAQQAQAQARLRLQTAQTAPTGQEQQPGDNTSAPTTPLSARARDKIVSSFTSNATSDWESATDSPAPPPSRQLPTELLGERRDSATTVPETNSGLAQVMSEGDRIAQEESKRKEEEAQASENIPDPATSAAKTITDAPAVITETPAAITETAAAQTQTPAPPPDAETTPETVQTEQEVQLAVAAATDKPSTQPAAPGARKSRAKFQIVDSEDTPPSPEQVRQLRHLQKIDRQPLDETGLPVPPTPEQAPTPPSPTPAAPVSSEHVNAVDEALAPTKHSKSEPDCSTVQPVSAAPSPPSVSQPASPRHVRTRGARKSSNASLISNNSSRSLALSFAGRMGPPATNFRRAASAVAPSIDRAAVASAEMASSADGEDRGASAGAESPSGRRRSGQGSSGTAPGSSGRHRRTESLGSVRSLRSVAESLEHPELGKGRAATIGPGASQRLRMTSGASGSTSGALAALQGAAKRDGMTTPSALGPKRNPSGYFSALRGFTTGLATGFTTPPALVSSPGAMGSGSTPIPTGPSGAAYGKGKARASPSPAQYVAPIVSKFVEPPTISLSPQQMTHAQQPSSSRAPLPTPALSDSGRYSSGIQRNQSSASLSGAMSRTQQKALLARDAPYARQLSSNGDGRGSGGGTGASGSGYYPPAPSSAANMHNPLPLPPPPAQQTLPAQGTYGSSSQQATRMSRTASGGQQQQQILSSSSSAQAAAASEARQQGMQKWAFGLVREAERIERQYRAVEKWRDPLGESLERVLARRRARAERKSQLQSGTNGSGAGTGTDGSAQVSGSSTPAKRGQMGQCLPGLYDANICS